MTPVRFTQSWRLWNANEVAGFPSDEAAALIKAGIAIAYDGEGEASPSATAEAVSEPHAVAQGAKPPRKKG
jgi:hypothetical protein